MKHRAAIAFASTSQTSGFDPLKSKPTARRKWRKTELTSFKGADGGKDNNPEQSAGTYRHPALSLTVDVTILALQVDTSRMRCAGNKIIVKKKIPFPFLVVVRWV